MESGYKKGKEGAENGWLYIRSLKRNVHSSSMALVTPKNVDTSKTQKDVGSFRFSLVFVWEHTKEKTALDFLNY